RSCTGREPYARLEAIEDGGRARLHDPLWLMTRQWQTGEFHAEDAGTPVQARVHLERTGLMRYKARGGAFEPYRPELPLDALVDREGLPRAVPPPAHARLPFPH